MHWKRDLAKLAVSIPFNQRMLKMFLVMATFSRLLVFELPVTNLSRLLNVGTSQAAVWEFICFMPYVF